MTIKRLARHDYEAAIDAGAHRLEVIKLVNELSVGAGLRERGLAVALILGDKRVQEVRPHATTWEKVKGAWSAVKADWNRGHHFVVRYP